MQRIDQLQAELSTTRSLLSDYSATLQQLTSLPSQFRPRHRVALGPLAFFPNGHLLHPSETLLLLGDGYFLQCTTERGRDVCRRRMQTLRAKEDRCIAEEKRVRERLEYGDSITGRTAAAAGEEAADDIVEIKEEYREEEGEGEMRAAAVSAPPGDGGREKRTAAAEGGEGRAAARGGSGLSEAEFNAYWDRLAELEEEEERAEQQKTQSRPRQKTAEEAKDKQKEQVEAQRATGEAEDEADGAVALPAVHSPADIYKQIKTRREQHGVSGDGSGGATQQPAPSPSSAGDASGAVRQREKRVSFSNTESVAVIDPVSTRPLHHHTHSPPPPASSFLPHSSPSPDSPPSPPPEPAAPAFSGAVRERLVEARSGPSVMAPVPAKKMSRFMAERLGLQPEDD